jgi:pilus assembly protein CpaC
MVMNIKTLLKTGVVFAAICTAGASYAAPGKPDTYASGVSDKVIVMSIGRGQQINLPSAVTDVVVANPAIADVDVRSSKQIYILAKGPGETTVFATDAAGRTVYSATIRVGSNIDSIDQMLKLTMPEADIQVTTMNGIVLLTGSVKQPDDVVEAEALVQQFVGEAKVVSRLKTATPMQVNLQVRIAEVSRSLAKEISSNFTTRDANGGGAVFGIGRGRQATITSNANPLNLPIINACTSFALPIDCGLQLPFNPQTGQFLTNTASTQFNFASAAGTNILNVAGKLFGLDVAAAFDLAERSGLSSTLANPNLTAMSGETGEFLAGGSFPIPVSDSFGAISVTQQSYGINLRYTPEVMADGKIRLRLRTEVSDITSQGAVRIGGTEIPALLTRMAETTVELGSGQSFMIAGLLSNQASSSVDKYPGIGDVPVVGALFRSNGWKRNQTELVIMVTPYLVNPVSESDIKLPTDGYNTPNDLERILMNKEADSSGKNLERPGPTVGPEKTDGPSLGSINDDKPALASNSKKSGTKTAAKADGPGFTFE